MRPPRPLFARAAFFAAALTLSLVLSLVLGCLHPFGDAELFAAPRSQPPQLSASIPVKAREVLAADCADCHSTPARAPVYGHFAPISWLMERDILEARAHLNLSAWDSYSPDRQQVLLAQIEQQAKAGHMPPPHYRIIHRDARLDSGNVAALVAWAHAASAATEMAEAAGAPQQREAAGQALLAPDPVRGQDLFNRRCTGCHALSQDREGPHLAGVYGRASASVPGFPYSGALVAAHLTWSDQTLDRWLTDPDGFVPGVNMDFRVPKAQERADVIAYLKSLNQ